MSDKDKLKILRARYKELTGKQVNNQDEAWFENAIAEEEAKIAANQQNQSTNTDPVQSGQGTLSINNQPEEKIKSIQGVFSIAGGADEAPDTVKETEKQIKYYALRNVSILSLSIEGFNLAPKEEKIVPAKLIGNEKFERKAAHAIKTGLIKKGVTMAVAAEIITAFKARFPEFDETTVDARLSVLISAYPSYYNDDYGSSNSEIILNLLAHLLMLDGKSAAQQVLTSKSLGSSGIKRTFAQPSGNSMDFFETTSYGQRFRMLTVSSIGGYFV